MRISSRNLRFFDPASGLDPQWNPVQDAPHILAQNLGYGASIYLVDWIGEDGKRLYTQPLIAERGGSCTIAVDPNSKRFAMAQMQRPYVRDPQKYREDFPEVDPENLGCLIWESARGLSKIGETYTETAKREAEEELGGRILHVHPLPPCTTNSTFFPQPTGLYWAEMDMTAPPRTPDELEGVGKVAFFSLEEYRQLQDEGEAIDALTGHALLSLILRHPHLLGVSLP